MSGTGDMRRGWTRRAALGMALTALAAMSAVPAVAVDAVLSEDLPESFGRWHGDESIGLLVYPNVSTLGVAAFLRVASLVNGASCQILGRSREPVATDLGWPIAPTVSFGEIGAPLDLLLVPGGVEGVSAVLADDDLLSQLRRLSDSARLTVTSGAGGLLLAATGAADGVELATPEPLAEALAAFGAIATARPVAAAARCLSARSDCGALDAGLAALVRLRSPLYAKTMQALADHDPSPPYPIARTPAIAREIVASLQAPGWDGLRAAAVARRRRTPAGALGRAG